MTDLKKVTFIEFLQFVHMSIYGMNFRLRAIKKNISPSF